jgi:transposase
MAKGYRPVRRDQPFLLPPDMREWLPADHVVWLLIALVGEHLDTSAFHALRRTGGAGAAGYDPDMLVTLLIWAYANDETSSRRIEVLCSQDVAFRVICAGDIPDHVTVARFRARFPGAVEELFTQVLLLCARLGMGRFGTVALDGTKIAAAASKDANRTEEGLRKLAAQRVAAHAEADAAEDELFGGRRGDEVPGEAADPRTRDERIAAALADLEAEREAAQRAQQAQESEHLQAAAAGTPKRGRRPAGAAAELARMRLEKEIAAQQARIDAWEQRSGAGAGSKTGRRPVPPARCARVRAAQTELDAALARQAQQAGPEEPADAGAKQEPLPVRNITDPDSRLMPVRGGGFLQGYNAQNVTSEDGLIIATRLTNDTTDCGWYKPLISDAAAAAAAMTAHRPRAAGGPGAAGAGGGQAGGETIGLVLADAGYCSQANLTSKGPDRLIATGKRRTLEKNARAAAGGEPPGTSGHDRGSAAIAAMTARLATEDGITAYRRRGHIAETPHGDIKHNMGLRQLNLRGIRKAGAEWTFACLIHNLRKAISSGHLTPAALHTLTSPAR